MAKIDCSTVIGFAHEASRVCEMYDDCGECPFSGRKKCPMAVLEYDRPDAQAIVDSLQKWSDEHSQKTRLDDLLEKVPKIALNDVTKAPYIKPYHFGYCKDCVVCPLRAKASVGVEYCWHEPVDGGATGKAVE